MKTAQTPYQDWISKIIQTNGLGAVGISQGLGDPSQEALGIQYDPTYGNNAFVAAGSPGGNYNSWLANTVLAKRGMTPEQFFASQPNVKFNPATGTVAENSYDDEDKGLQSFWGGPLMVGGAFAGIGGGLSALTGGSSATGGAATGGNVFDLFNPDTWNFVGDLPTVGDAGGGSLMPPAQLDPSVGNFLNTGDTVPGGGSIFSPDGMNPSALNLGGGSMLDNLPSGLKDLVQKMLMSPGGSGPNGTAASFLKSLGIAPDSILGSGLNLAARSAPGLMALKYAQDQNDNGLGAILDQLKGNQGAIVKAATDPLQANIAAGYGDLLQSQGLRGIRGSSFGNTDIANYLGRTGDALAGAGAKAAEGSLALQAQITNQANTNKNNLYGKAFDILGRGLSPSGFGSTLTLAGA